ncbi:MAG: type IX secretion system plug protein domain-containing protein [Bacteroidota bacterium]
MLSAGTLITRPLSPDRSSVPVRSGNYLLKVFLNNDTSSLLFTKRFLVVDSRVSIAAQILQPFNMQLSRSDQRVQVGVSTVNAQINTLSPAGSESGGTAK